MSYRKIESFPFNGGRVVVGYSSEWCEYRARLYFGSVAYDAADYYTTDKQDALIVGVRMANQSAQSN